jgi:hypothetical protein
VTGQTYQNEKEIKKDTDFYAPGHIVIEPSARLSEQTFWVKGLYNSKENKREQ